MLRLRHGLHHGGLVISPWKSGSADGSAPTSVFFFFFCSLQVSRIREYGLPDDPRPAGVHRVPSRAAALHLRPQLPHPVGPSRPAAPARAELTVDRVFSCSSEAWWWTASSGTSWRWTPTGTSSSAATASSSCEGPVEIFTRLVGALMLTLCSPQAWRRELLPQQVHPEGRHGPLLHSQHALQPLRSEIHPLTHVSLH